MIDTGIRFSRQWAMPDKETFLIKPINELVGRLLHYRQYSTASVDPFSNGKRYARLTNDLNPDVEADEHMDALDFLRTIDDNAAMLVLFDPPYSSRQVAECYKKFDRTVDMQTTQGSYWANLKKEISRIVRPKGKVLTCSWNSGGIGKEMGFEIEEILLVAHGGWHNDTICTVEQRQATLFDNQELVGRPIGAKNAEKT